MTSWAPQLTAQLSLEQDTFEDFEDATEKTPRTQSPQRRLSSEQHSSLEPAADVMSDPGSVPPIPNGSLEEEAEAAHPVEEAVEKWPAPSNIRISNGSLEEVTLDEGRCILFWCCGEPERVKSVF